MRVDKLIAVIFLFVISLGFSFCVSAESETIVPEGFRVIIIGSGNPQLSAQRANASVLVQYKDKQFLVDCGSGSVASMLKLRVEQGKITNILFTHHHADHNADFWGFAIGGWGYPGGRRLLNLIGPVGTKKLQKITPGFYRDDLEYRIRTVGFPEEGIRRNIHIKDLTKDTESFELDGVKITAIVVPNTIKTYAYRFDAGGQSVVVSGDLTYTPRFAPFAKDADIIVFDGQMSINFSDVPPEQAEAMQRNLLKSNSSNPEIAKIAAEASPKKFILTHLSGTMDLPANIKLYCDTGFKGELLQAYDGLIIEP